MRWAVVGLALAGCVAAPEPRMTSVALFDFARFEGAWQEAYTLGRAQSADWMVGPVEEGRLAMRVGGAESGARIVGPGRLESGVFDSPLWVLWADADMRVVVLAARDRSFAAVLHRGGQLSPDLMEAARDVLAWNGFEG